MYQFFRSFLLVGTVLLMVCEAAISASDVVPKNPVVQSSVLSQQTDATEVKLLQRQLEDSRKFQEQILATVYWSLGVLATMAAALVGFGWFANFRIYERDKASIERELRAQIREDINLFREQISDSLSVSEKKNHESMLTQLGKVQENIDGVIKLQAAGLEKKILTLQSSTTSKLQDLNSDLLSLKLDNALKQRLSWLDQNIVRNALQASVTALEIANKIGYDLQVGDVLDLVSEDISKILNAKGRPVDNFLVAQLIRVLDEVQGAHAHVASTLKNKTSQLLVQ